jgi:hypothetical protein
MGDLKLFLNVVAGRDGLYHPALCFSEYDEIWYLFQDNSGFCFRNLKEGLTHDYTPAEMKVKKYGVYREMNQKWNQINSILKGNSQID